MNGTAYAPDFFFVPPSPEQEREDFRAALKHANTRRIFRRLLNVGNAMGPSKALGEGNTEYNEGIRALALWLAGKIENAAPGEFAALMRESGEERIAWNAAQKSKEN
ncbi:MAG: hypothetical protein LBB52_06350 [Desulfovibrio sp.]|jgi:hypothetical protein|nr:hypothetical protein [Desulfovibrio sp.]